MADYNINAITRRVVFSGSAGLGPYAFTFEILDENDIAVYFNATKLTITTDYTVTINANGTGSATIVTGGSVPSTPTASDSITIVGARDIERTTDFVTAGDLRAAALNEQLDGQIIMTQQLAEENKRSMQAPVTDPAHVDDGGTLNMTLPAKADRAGKYLAFNATTGNPEAGPDQTDVTALSAITSDIATLADIEDGTDATDAIQTVAGISSNVTTVAGISANVTTVAGDTTNIGTVATDLAGSDTIGTVAGSISNVNTVGTNIASVNTNASNITAINTNATNITDIQNASANAASALASKNAAATSEANAATSESNAASSASSASSSATSASSSASSASASAATATTKAGEASTSAANASTSETNSAASAASASTSASNASASASAAASSASSASSAQTAAEAARDSALAAYDNFDDRYLGVKSSDPTLDNDGNALVAGALYFNSVSSAMKVYTGSAWVAAYVSGTDYLALSGGSMTGDITFGDNDKATFGDAVGGDLQIYHDAGHSRIVDAGTGNLRIQADDLRLQTADGTGNYISADNGGAATLYHNALAKLATTSSGIDVTGTVTFDGGTTSADLNFGDNDKAVFGASSDLQIFHDGTQSYVREVGTGGLNLNGTNLTLRDSTNTNTYATFTNGGNATLWYNNSQKLATTSSGVSVTGTVAATSFTGDGSSLTGIAAGATGGGSDEIFWENGQTVTSNYTITNGKNAMSAGPITINTGVTVTVGTGETWTVV